MSRNVSVWYICITIHFLEVNFLTIIRIVIFIIGLILIRYVGGVPTDSRNFFITQFVFFISFLLDYHKFIFIEHKFVKVLIYFGYIAGFFILMLNILGIFGIISIVEDGVNYFLIFNESYQLGNKHLIEMTNFMNVGAIAYLYIFFSMIAFEQRLYPKKRLKTEGVVQNVPMG